MDVDGAGEEKGDETNGEGIEILEQNGGLHLHCLSDESVRFLKKIEPEFDRLISLTSASIAKSKLSNGNGFTESLEQEFSEPVLSVLNEVTEYSESILDLDEIQRLVDSKFLPSFCAFVEILNEQELNNFQEILVKYVLENWPASYSLPIIELIAHIFVCIARIAPSEIVEEYLSVFSSPSMPPQVVFFILPIVLSHISSEIAENDEDNDECQEESVEADVQLLTKLLRMSRKDIPDNSDIKMLTLIWSQLYRKGCSTSLIRKMLPLCANTSLLVQFFDQDALTLVINTVIRRFLQEATSGYLSYGILASCIILLGLHKLEFGLETKAWPDICDICARIVKRCTEINHRVPLIVTRFAIKCVCSFIDKVQVESEPMLDKLKIILLKMPSTEVSKINRILSQRNERLLPHKEQEDTQNKRLMAESEYYVPMIEKITRKIISENVELSENDKQRLNVAFDELHDFMTKN